MQQLDHENNKKIMMGGFDNLHENGYGFINENSQGFRSTDFPGYKPYQKPGRDHSWRDDFELDELDKEIQKTNMLTKSNIRRMSTLITLKESYMTELKNLEVLL